MRAAARLRVPKTAEVVADHVRRQIIVGELQAGDKLPPEAMLMESFGLSRASIREAFRILEAERFVDVVQGARCGAIILRPAAQTVARYAAHFLQANGVTVRSLYAARLAIEPLLVSQLATAPQGDMVERLAARALRIRSHAHLEHYGAVQSELAHLYDDILDDATLQMLGFIGQLLLHLSLSQQRHAQQRIGLDPSVLKSRVMQSVDAFDHLVQLIQANDIDGASARWQRYIECLMTTWADGVDGDRLIEWVEG